MSYGLVIFWIAVTLVTTLSFTAIIDPNNMEVSAQGNNRTSGIEYNDNMTTARTMSIVMMA